MFDHLIPQDMHPPFANYAHAISVPAGARWLFVSGQLGVDLAGAIPSDVAAQAELIFQNIAKILRDGGMTLQDLVRLNAYLTDPADLAAYMAVRDRHVAEPAPASTLLVVHAFARPEFKVEIEAVAAKPD